MNNKESAVIFINPQVEQDFEKLQEDKFEGKKLYSFIVRAISDIKQNPAVGIKNPHHSKLRGIL